MHGAPRLVACRCGIAGEACRTIPAPLSLKCIFEVPGTWPKQERRVHCCARLFRLARRAISRRRSVRACRAVTAITSNCLRPQMGAPAASLGMLDRDYRGRMWRHRAAGFFREGPERGGSFSGTQRSRCTPFNPPPLLQCTVCAAILKRSPGSTEAWAGLFQCRTTSTEHLA